MNETLQTIAPAAAPQIERASVVTSRRTPWSALLALPFASASRSACIFSSRRMSCRRKRGVQILLAIILGFAFRGGGAVFLAGLRRWMIDMFPIIAGAVVLLTAWKWPPPVSGGCRCRFPEPSGLLQSLIIDRALIFDSTRHSPCCSSAAIRGVISGVVTGVCIGWFEPARYWGMPVLKVVGPIPATAWIPLAMVVSPNAMFSAIALIALAVWFPVTMLTASGISNTRASYLDVARTLGASRAYLIFRVAIPAAMPNIFIGLFMGLGASFLTLIVAEQVGVKSGLGW